MKRALEILCVGLFFFSFTLSTPKGVMAGCSTTGFDVCDVCGPTGAKWTCKSYGTTAEQTGICKNGTGGFDGSGYCSSWVSTCDTPKEANDVCGGSGSVPSCPGTCDSSTCGTNGACNCNDFGIHDSCEGLNGWPTPIGCYWDNLGHPEYGWNYGVCKGRYCCGTGDVCTGGDYNCASKGCNFTPTYNSCAASSPCSNGSCVNECGNATACYSCAPSAPTGTPVLSSPADGVMATVNVTLIWNKIADNQWGNTCTTTQNNTYKVYLGTNQNQVSNGNSNALAGTVVSAVSAYTTSNLQHAQTYYWKIVPNNGLSDGPSSVVRSFTTDAQSYWQVTGGNVVGKGISSVMPANSYIDLAN